MRNNNSAGVRQGYMSTTGTEETRQHPDVSVCVLSSLSLCLSNPFICDGVSSANICDGVSSTNSWRDVFPV